MSEGLKARMRTVKAVVFDLDDTLVESKVDFPKFKRLVIEKIVSYGEDRGHYKETETVVRTISRFEERMQKTGVNRAEIEKRLGELDRIMDEVEMERAGETSAYKGASRILGLLRKRGIKTGILTRGCQSYVSTVLANTRLENLIDAIECRNSHSKPKPNPEAYLRLVDALGVSSEETIFVGDHPIDATCAANAGVPFIAVMTGDVPEETLAKAGSAKVFRDIDELADWLEEAIAN